MATQSERRDATRSALLDAGARLFAERGVADSSVDAIAEAAGRTSGALYDHFGSKDGLLFALLEGWVDDVAAVIAAELVTAHTLEERMAALWRNVAEPAVGGGRWIALEHELWSYAARNASAGERLTDRYHVAWEGLDALADGSVPAGALHPTAADDSEIGPAILGLLLGLEMMRRIDPDAISDRQAVSALCGVVTSSTVRSASSSATTTNTAPGSPIRPTLRTSP